MAKIKLMPSGVEDMPPMSCLIFDDNDEVVALIPYSVYELQPSSNEEGLVLHLYVTKKRGGSQKVGMVVGIGTTVQAYTVNADGGLSELTIKSKED